jgi:hypothetical protein
MDILIAAQLIKNFPTFYGTRKFTIVHKNPPLVPSGADERSPHIHIL